MKGLNKKFTDKPEEFLRGYVMGEVGKLSTNYRMKPDVYHFDLVPSKGNEAVAELHQVDPKAHKGDEELIKAYWLPWFPERTNEIGLGNDASYFFTSSLAGCRLQMVPATGPGCKVKVLHIAGDKGGMEKDAEGVVVPGAGQGGTDWRDKEAEKKLTSEERKRSRAFSATKETPHGYKKYKDDPEAHFVFVVGFITKLKTESEWEFWAQARQRAITGNPILKDTWRIWEKDERSVSF